MAIIFSMLNVSRLNDYFHYMKLKVTSK